MDGAREGWGGTMGDRRGACGMGRYSGRWLGRLWDGWGADVRVGVRGDGWGAGVIGRLSG